MEKTKFKKRLLIIIVIVLMLVIGVVLYFILNNANNKKKTTTKSENTKEIVAKIGSVLKQDYEIKNLIYGTPTLTKTLIKIKDKSYYYYESNTIKTIDDINKLIIKTYVSVEANHLQDDLGKYNTFASIDNKLYVSLNPKCINIIEYKQDLIKYDSKTSKQINFYYGKIDYNVFIENNNYKIRISPFECYE